MQFEWILLSLLIGYFVGSFSFSRLITHIAAPGLDLTRIPMKDQGTGEDYYLTNVGATTASMVLGPKVGGLISLMDILKGFFANLNHQVGFS